MMRGTQNTGLSIALDDQGIVQARIGDQGSVSTVFSENSIRDGAWHHLVVTFGDSPKAFKMYLNGQLMNQPVIHSSGVISLHLDDPSLGAISDTSLFPGYGFYKGFLDDLRIYERGLDAVEVVNVFEGDFTNNGYLDFLAIEKPEIVTKSAIDVSPDGATLRLEVLSIGGEIEEQSLSNSLVLNKILLKPYRHGIQPLILLRITTTGRKLMTGWTYQVVTSTSIMFPGIHGSIKRFEGQACD